MRTRIGGKGDITYEVPRIMGILNLTPDSFSDGGMFNGEDAARHVFEMIDEGADIIDIGGESSRPGSSPVTEAEEMARVIPFLREYARSITVPISIDTCKASVASAALDAGADIINDITGLADEGMMRLAAEGDVPVVIMHMHGTPATMKDNPMNDIGGIVGFLRDRKESAERHGVKQMIMDPGVGFGKTAALDDLIIDNASMFSFGCPVLIGASRKSFLRMSYPGMNPDVATAKVSERAVRSGANILRVHDVKGTVSAIRGRI